MDEQQSVAVGIWLRKEGGKDVQVADANVYLISTADAASWWIADYDKRPLAEGWTAIPHAIGRASFLATYRDGKRYTITFAQDRFIVTVSGASKSDAHEVATVLLDQVADS